MSIKHIMKLFVISATLVAYTFAAPTLELLHPSPVNPNVLVAIKPEEKIIMMTDPKEIAKYKRETKQPLYPTVLPKAKEYHITEHDTHKEIKTHDEKKDEHYENVKNFSPQEPQTLPLLLKEHSLAKEKHKRDIPVPLVPKHHHPEESSTEKSRIKPDTNEEIIEDQKGKDFLDEQQHKRDIPLPLIPKYHHPVETEKYLNEQDSKSQKNFKKLQQQKRELRVSLMPQPENKEVKSGNSDISQAYSYYKAHVLSSDKIPIHNDPSRPNTNKHDNIQTNQKEKVSVRPESEDKKDELSIHKPVAHDVQMEDLTLSKPSHKPINHVDSDHNQNNQNGHLTASQYAISSTDNSLLRPHPVPVAELFARGQEN